MSFYSLRHIGFWGSKLLTGYLSNAVKIGSETQQGVYRDLRSTVVVAVVVGCDIKLKVASLKPPPRGNLWWTVEEREAC